MISKKPFSASLSVENIEYINNEVSKKQGDYPRYNKSHWLDDLVTHLRNKSKPSKTQLVNPANPEKSKRFTPPTMEDVFQYCNERCNNVDAQAFVDHYSSNGWMRGKTKIKDWKACVRTWEKSSKDKTQARQFSKTTEQNINTIGEWLNE